MPPPLHILSSPFFLCLRKGDEIFPSPHNEESERNSLFRNHNIAPRLSPPSQSSPYLAWDREMGKGTNESNFSMRPELVAEHNSSWSPEVVKCQTFCFEL